MPNTDNTEVIEFVLPISPAALPISKPNNGVSVGSFPGNVSTAFLVLTKTMTGKCPVSTAE
jgi:hypothetical protein